LLKRGKTMLVLVLLVLVSVSLSACTRDKPTIYVYNWGDYIDESIIGGIRERNKHQGCVRHLRHQ
jgi:spermidine/putrescine-binding protein